jgi:hypothetical protein
MATNYPLVQLRGTGSVGMVFCRTFDHSTMAVATGSSIQHTHFKVPPHLQHGRYELVVIANGIESEPMEVHVGEEEKEHHEHEMEHKEHHNGWSKKHEYIHEEEGNLKLELTLPLPGAKN